MIFWGELVAIDFNGTVPSSWFRECIENYMSNIQGKARITSKYH